MFLKVGHRGAKAYETENTLESFRKAIELGVNAVELDVRKSKDGKLVVFHDDNLKRMFGKDIRANNASLKELKELTENRIPSFEEALGFLDRKVEKILVEIKEPGCEKKLLDAIKKKKLEKRAIIISFHEEAIAGIRKLNKKIETGLVYAKHKSPVDTALKLNAQYLVPLYRFIHTGDVENAHQNNLKVVVWTINTKDEAREYMAKGVDGIATDMPDIFPREEIAYRNVGRTKNIKKLR